MSASILEYIKELDKGTEYYQIVLDNSELLYLHREDPKLFTKLSDAKILVPVSEEILSEKEKTEASPFCLKLEKKGHLTNLERPALISDDKTVKTKEIKSLLYLYNNKLKAKDLEALQGILSEVIMDEDAEFENEEDKQTMDTAIAKIKESKFSEAKKQQIAKTFEENEGLLEAFFSGNADKSEIEETNSLIERILKFFELRIKAVKFNKKEISNFPLSLLQKISLFIEYEGFAWDTTKVPKSVLRFIISNES